jgi:hypothetical protein
MLLDGKVAVIYEAGRAIGGAVARAFARDGSAHDQGHGDQHFRRGADAIELSGSRFPAGWRGRPAEIVARGRTSYFGMI